MQGILSLGQADLYYARRLRHGDVPDARGQAIAGYRARLHEAFLSWKTYPWFWSFTEHFWYALLLVLIVPGLLAFIFGYFAFRSRIKGVYFSIITQALTFAAMLLFFRNETGFGGNNGFTDFKRILGFDITSPQTRAVLYWSDAGRACRLADPGPRSDVVKRRGIERELRDAEEVDSGFWGMNRWASLFVWTLSAMICGIAGALYVPQVGIINPGESTENSIEMVIWVATGGRGHADRSDHWRGHDQRAENLVHERLPEFWLCAGPWCWRADPLRPPGHHRSRVAPQLGRGDKGQSS